MARKGVEDDLLTAYLAAVSHAKKRFPDKVPAFWHSWAAQEVARLVEERETEGRGD